MAINIGPGINFGGGISMVSETASQEQLDKLKFGTASFVTEKTEQMAVSSI